MAYDLTQKFNPLGGHDPGDECKCKKCKCKKKLDKKGKSS